MCYCRLLTYLALGSGITLLEELEQRNLLEQREMKMEKAIEYLLTSQRKDEVQDIQGNGLSGWTIDLKDVQGSDNSQRIPLGIVCMLTLAHHWSADGLTTGSWLAPLRCPLPAYLRR
jgi:4-aminobutyrate aminotransferase-like enzyme